MTTGDVSNQTSGPLAQPIRLWVSHATEEGNHRVDEIARDVENGHVPHVLPVAATNDENIPPGLH